MNLAELEKLAEAATPGPWNIERQIKRMTVKAGTVVVTTVSPNRDQRANAAYIAACDPDTVLALISKAKQQANEALIDANTKLVGALDMIHETLKGGNVQDLIYIINTALAENERTLAELPQL